jgi:hypothetical protein
MSPYYAMMRNSTEKTRDKTSDFLKVTEKDAIG